APTSLAVATMLLSRVPPGLALAEAVCQRAAEAAFTALWPSLRCPFRPKLTLALQSSRWRHLRCQPPGSPTFPMERIQYDEPKKKRGAERLAPELGEPDRPWALANHRSQSPAIEGAIASRRACGGAAGA